MARQSSTNRLRRWLSRDTDEEDEEENEADVSIMHAWFFSVTNWWDDLDKPKASVVVILVFINLINYMDRSTVAGMINSIRNDSSFDVQSDQALGLLQTAFVVFYMIFAPIFGYLGDRYDRTRIMLVGIFVWAAATFIGSLMRDFWWFMVFRAVVGIGEASYSTIAPAIISDLYRRDTRSRVLALFYFAIPVGTGLGYMVGAQVADLAPDWRWGLRVTPVLGLIALLAIFFFVRDPPRGQSEGDMAMHASENAK